MWTLSALLLPLLAENDAQQAPCLFRNTEHFEEVLEKEFQFLGQHMGDTDATDRVLETIRIKEDGNSQGLVFFGGRKSAAFHAVQMMADALFGPSKHGFLSINVTEELQAASDAVEAAKSTIKQKIRWQMKNKCAGRSLLLLTGLELLRAKQQLPILDVLIDMLNNGRPFLQVDLTTLNCAGVTVVLLFEEDLEQKIGWVWQEELESRWAYDGEVPCF